MLYKSIWDTSCFQSINFPNEQGVLNIELIEQENCCFQSINFPNEQGDAIMGIFTNHDILFPIN